jgi:uncharacterized protein YrrD
LNEQKKRWKNCRWKEEGRKNEVADKERGQIVVGYIYREGFFSDFMAVGVEFNRRRASHI